jgi:hypothetical protein
MRITDKHLEHLRVHGYVIIKGFLTPDELASAREGFHQYYPTERELHATPQRYGSILEDADQLQTEFPYSVDALNHIATHPAILSGVKRYLGVDDVRLSQSAIWAKYAGTGDFEQGLHFDYQGNTLVVPRDDLDYQQLNFIIYYSEVTKNLAPTGVVSKSETRGVSLWPPFKTRARHPELYAIEKKVVVPAGSMLIFTMSTLHRGTGMIATEGARYTHHLVYRSAAHDFQGYHLYARLGESQDLERFVQTAMPEQREALGFPRPTDPYWTRETLRACKLRYPGLDWSVWDLSESGASNSLTRGKPRAK